MTDEEFQSAITSLLEGNKEGLRHIYESYVRLIYTVVLDVVKRREDAEDVTSDFFIKLIRVAEQFKKGSPHKTWMVTIARNMAFDFLRKSNREILSYEGEEDDDSLNLVEKTAASADDKSVENKAILAQDMKNAMEKLSPKEKEIVDMKLLGELKFKEIATITGQPMGTVTWIYNQAIIKLRRCLKNYEQS